MTREEAQAFAESINVPYLETSAKERTNIEESFLQLATNIYECLPEQDK